jgi:hypothetical protein
MRCYLQDRCREAQSPPDADYVTQYLDNFLHEGGGPYSHSCLVMEKLEGRVSDMIQGSPLPSQRSRTYPLKYSVASLFSTSMGHVTETYRLAT